MAKITYIEHTSKKHIVEVPNNMSVMEGAVQNNIPASMQTVADQWLVPHVMFMSMKNGLISLKKKMKAKKICWIWLINQTNLVD